MTEASGPTWFVYILSMTKCLYVLNNILKNIAARLGLTKDQLADQLFK